MTWTTQRRSDLGGLSAILAGAGPHVVLIHGVGLRAEAWARQIETLSVQFSVTAVDMPGHGESLLLDQNATLTAYTDVIADVVQRRSVVIGHSMGAMIALDLAQRYPEQVCGVAALNAVYRRNDIAKKAVRQRADALDGISVPDPDETLTRWFGGASSSERLACHEWLTTVDPKGYAKAYQVFASQDGPSDTALSAMQAPALFLTGSAEPNSTSNMSLAMAARAPRGQSQIIRGAAHMMPMTHAAEVNQALMQFAQEVL